MTLAQRVIAVLDALPGSHVSVARELGVSPSRLRHWRLLARLDEAGVGADDPRRVRAHRSGLPPSESQLAALVALAVDAKDRLQALVSQA